MNLGEFVGYEFGFEQFVAALDYDSKKDPRFELSTRFVGHLELDCELTVLED